GVPPSVGRRARGPGPFHGPCDTMRPRAKFATSHARGRLRARPSLCVRDSAHRVLGDSGMWHTKTEANRAIQGGIVAGIVGGVVLAVILMILQAGSGLDVWRALKGASAPFLRDRALAPGFDALAVVVGVVSHFAVSILWGIGFGLLAIGLTRAGTVVFGL